LKALTPGAYFFPTNALMVSQASSDTNRKRPATSIARKAKEFPMKRLIPLLVAIFFLHSGHAQSSELTVHVNSGLFSFGGASAEKHSFVSIGSSARPSGGTNNPYGRRSGGSYGIGLQFQRTTSVRFLFGVQIAYESLASRIDIDNVYGKVNWTVEEGSTRLRNQFVNFYPFAGGRLEIIEKLRTDIGLGFDLGLCLSSTEHGKIKISRGEVITTLMERSKPDIDVRPRVQLTNYYGRVGLSLGYALGLTNYTSRMIGANRTNESRYARIGLSYRLYSKTPQQSR
jgi:hypothetical protein